MVPYVELSLVQRIVIRDITYKATVISMAQTMLVLSVARKKSSESIELELGGFISVVTVTFRVAADVTTASVTLDSNASYYLSAP